MNLQIKLSREPAALLEHHLLMGLGPYRKAAPTNNVPSVFVYFVMLQFSNKNSAKACQTNFSLKSEQEIRNQLVSSRFKTDVSEWLFNVSQRAIAQRNDDPLPPFNHIWNNKTNVNLVKEGHAYEEKFSSLGILFIKKRGHCLLSNIFKRRRKMGKNALRITSGLKR